MFLTCFQDGEEDERFATIRPINAILRQREQHQSNDDFREQMNVYKQMRQQHQKQLLQLENKLKNEMNEHKKQLDREYESQVHQFEREMEKLKSKHKTDFDQKVRPFNGKTFLSVLITNTVSEYNSILRLDVQTNKICAKVLAQDLYL